MALCFVADLDYLVALGGNVGEREKMLWHARLEIASRVGELQAFSRLYETKAQLHALNPAPQPNYLNAALLVRTSLGPDQVLDALLAIEAALGRKRGAEQLPWAARVIDLDLIGTGALVLKARHLEIPHPRMHERDFVLAPLLDIAPAWRHPLLNRTVRELYAGLRAPPSIISCRPWVFI